MTEDEVLRFIANSIPSIWALELLFLLQSSEDIGRTMDDLVMDLRSSSTAIAQAIRQLQNSGLVIEDAHRYIYRPASPILDLFAREARKLYAVKPLSVLKVIGSARNENLQRFADSFKLKE